MTQGALNLDVGRAFYGNFHHLRQAQREAIRPVLSGSDVLVLAGTGSGKTEAVLAPLVQRWIPTMRKAEGCTVIYVAPTRALANDLVRRLEPPLNELGLNVGIRHGERDDLARGRAPHVLITTPESLDVLLTTRNQALRSVRSVVLDEIHWTYNTQRGFQLAILLKRLQRFVETAIQVVGLSATVATPEDIWGFFRPGQNFVTVRDDQAKPLDALIRVISSQDDLLELLDKLGATSEIKVLVFANSRRECDRLGATLRRSKSFRDNVYVHHSSLDRDARLDVEKRFQASAKAICVATSTLELGVDIGDIDIVMLYGHPGGWESFLQRVGRGNRRSGKTNVACIVSSQDHGPSFRTILAFKALLAQIHTGRLERERPLGMYGAAAQQLMAILCESNGAYQHPSIFTEVFSDWSHLNQAAIEDILLELARLNYLNQHDFQNRYGAGPALHRLRDLRLIWGNFPSRSREIRLIAEGHQIGTVPATNLMRLCEGTIVRFGGRHWRVRRVIRDSVELESSKNAAGLEISYGGTGVGMDPVIVEEMLRFIESGRDDCGRSAEDRDFAGKLHQLRSYIGWDKLPVARGLDGAYHYLTFGGRLLNNVIARWAGLQSYNVDDFVLRSDRQINFPDLPIEPRELSHIAALALQVPEELTFFQNVLPLPLLVRELSDVWIKAPVYQRSLERLNRARACSVVFADMAPLCN